MKEHDSERNGISRKEYFEALKVVADWNRIPPYKIEEGIKNVLSRLNLCPGCGVYLHETNTEPSALRTESNILLPFSQGSYRCKSCAEIQEGKS